jgi:hypothetical protein
MIVVDVRGDVATAGCGIVGVGNGAAVSGNRTGVAVPVGVERTAGDATMGEVADNNVPVEIGLVFAVREGSSVRPGVDTLPGTQAASSKTPIQTNVFCKD